MNETLYLVKHECEDDPYCAHWYETSLMTHDRDIAFKELRSRCEGVDEKEITDDDGFIEEYVYDESGGRYVFDKKIYASPRQIGVCDLDFENVKEDILKFMYAQDVESRCFKAVLDARIYSESVHREFDFTLVKCSVHEEESCRDPSSPFGFSIYLKGSDISKYGSVLDCSLNWWSKDYSDENVFRVLKNHIISGYSVLTDDLYSFVDSLYSK